MMNTWKKEKGERTEGHLHNVMNKGNRRHCKYNSIQTDVGVSRGCTVKNVNFFKHLKQNNIRHCKHSFLC